MFAARGMFGTSGAGGPAAKYVAQLDESHDYVPGDFVVGMNVIGVRYAGVAYVYLPSDLETAKLIAVKSETLDGTVTVRIYDNG
jgi:hypothetical protein